MNEPELARTPFGSPGFSFGEKPLREAKLPVAWLELQEKSLHEKINRDDPAQRAQLIERVGAKAYNEAFAAYQKESILETVNGHAIRPVGTRFGRLFMVGNTSSAFQTLDQAREFAQKTTSTG